MLKNVLSLQPPSFISKLTKNGFRLLPFRSPLLGKCCACALYFIFLWLLRCFTSPGLLPTLLSGNAIWLALRFRIRKSPDQSPLDGSPKHIVVTPRPSSPFDVKASSIRPYIPYKIKSSSYYWGINLLMLLNWLLLNSVVGEQSENAKHRFIYPLIIFTFQVTTLGNILGFATVGHLPLAKKTPDNSQICVYLNKKPAKRDVFKAKTNTQTSSAFCYEIIVVFHHIFDYY